LPLTRGSKRLVKIGLQVAHVLEPDGKPDGVVENAELGASLWRQPLMRRRGRVRNEALGVAEIVADLEDRERVHEAERVLLIALHLERDHRASAIHLLQSQLVLRMIASARIEHSLNLRLVGEEIGYGSRRGAMPIDPQGQRLPTLEQYPGIERTQRGSCLLEVVIKFFIYEGLAAQHNAAETASLAIDVLGRGIADDVGAERKWPLQHRRGEYVVDHDQRIRLMRDFRHGLDVDKLKHRIGRRFKEEGFGIRPHRVLPSSEITPVHQCRLDAVARQKILDDIAAGAEQRTGRNDMVAGLEKTEQGSSDSGHAARCSTPSLCSLEPRQGRPPTCSRSDWKRGYRRSLPRRP